MKISIITATYNSEEYIHHCLQSISSQTYSNIEHIVIDGGSNDRTPGIIKSTQSITKWVSEPDEGIYDALNKGVKMASGDIIGLLHSDDIFYSKDTIEKLLNLFTVKGDTDHKRIHGVFGDLVFTKNRNTDKIVRTWRGKSFKSSKIKCGWMPPHPTLFLRKEVFQKHGLYDTSYKVSADYKFMLQLMKDKDINLAYFPEIVTKMRIGGASTGTLKQILRKSTEDFHVLRSNGFKFPLLVLIAKNMRKIPQIFIR